MVPLRADFVLFGTEALIHLNEPRSTTNTLWEQVGFGMRIVSYGETYVQG